MRILRKAALTLLTTAGALSLGLTAHAHGNSKPQHGGIVQVSGETVIELVTGPKDLALYVSDDGDPTAKADVTAMVTVTRGGAQTKATLAPAPGNRFDAKGLGVAKGDAVAVLLIDKATQAHIMATFTIQ